MKASVRRSGLIAAFVVAASVASLHAASHPNFDLREAKSKAGLETLARHIGRHGTSHATRREAAAKKIREAAGRLKKELPSAEIALSERIATPEVVIVRSRNARLRNVRGEAPEQSLRRFLEDNASLYGLERSDLAQLRKNSEYPNPAGNLRWVTLEQTINGFPLFRGTLRGAFTADGALFATIGELPAVTASDALTARPLVDAPDAVVVAAESIDRQVTRGELRVKAQSPREVVFEPGPFAGEIRAELLYFPLDIGAVELAWSIVLWEEEAAYWTIVGAEQGDVLWRKNIVEDQSESVTMKVYDSDSPTPFSPADPFPGTAQGAPAARTSFTLVSELPTFDNLGWLTDGANVTTGNNVDAGLDLDAVNGIDAGGRATGSPYRTFDFPYTPAGHPGAEQPELPNYRMGAVTNLFFWTNRYHDRLYQLGFTEAAGNFQQDNFGRGGVANDAVSAEAQDSSGTSNANFATPPDGGAGRMQMYIFDLPNPRRDGDLDQEIILHELTHGTSNRLHADASGLSATMSRGMGEGWSDFYARALLSTADEDLDGIYTIGGYSSYFLIPFYESNYYYGIRRFPYALKRAVGANGKPHNPLTFADIDGAQIDLSDGAFGRGPIGSTTAFNVHNIGEVWASALFEVRARLIERLGFEGGNARALQIVTDGMKLDPLNPTFIQGRDSILAADCAAYGGEDELDIWEGFSTRGVGFSASSASAGLQSVVEAFDMPNLLATLTAVSDVRGNGNGYPEPGESLVLTISLHNPYCANPASDATATVERYVAQYGTISGSSSVSRTVDFDVPAGAACGDAVTIPVQIDSSLGPATTSVMITLGEPLTPVAENFDGVTAPALPTGWTSSATGDLEPWLTSTTDSASPPNSARAAQGGTIGDEVGLAELVSNEVTVTNPNAALWFANLFNLETAYDGLVLDISINGGAWNDVIAAGGTFVSGGYTGTLSSGFGNPLGGRQAWSGVSAGTSAVPEFIATGVTLPPAAAGQLVRFRWRMGTDSSFVPAGAAGARIDDIRLVDGYACSPVSAGPLDHFTIYPIASQKKSIPFAIEIVAKDANEATVTSFSGSVTISDSSGTITPTASGSFSNGHRTETVTISQPGMTAITVSDGTHSGTSNPLDIVPPLAVQGFIPNNGAHEGGQQVLLTGTGFVEGCEVTIGGVAAPATWNTPGSLVVTIPQLSAGSLSDVMVTNPDGESATLEKAWLADFADVPQSHGFHDFIEAIYRAGITGGCGGGSFCPSAPTTRAQVAVFLLAAKYGAGYAPPPASGTVFGDVAQSSFAAAWIEQLYADGITGGCSVTPPLYCPSSSVTRASMAVFLIKAHDGTVTVGTPSGVFDDVPTQSPFAWWIEELYARGITGGCSASPLLYCPSNPVTRGQMAVFLTATWGLPMN